mgnify:CR=1 FL=1
MIPKPFTTIAVDSEIKSISVSKLIQKLEPIVKIDTKENIDRISCDIIITENRQLQDNKKLIILIDLGSNPIEENSYLRLFQPMLNNDENFCEDFTDLLVEYVEAILAIYNFPIIKNNTTLELE